MKRKRYLAPVLCLSLLGCGKKTAEYEEEGFDYFGQLSHPDYTETLTQEQIDNRMILREAMVEHGFRPLPEEWWHFTLEDEPYPDTYFDFPVDMPED